MGELHTEVWLMLKLKKLQTILLTTTRIPLVHHFHKHQDGTCLTEVMKQLIKSLQITQSTIHLSQLVLKFQLNQDLEQLTMVATEKKLKDKLLLKRDQSITRKLL